MVGKHRGAQGKEGDGAGTDSPVAVSSSDTSGRKKEMTLTHGAWVAATQGTGPASQWERGERGAKKWVA